MPLLLSCFEHLDKPLLHYTAVLHDVLKKKGKTAGREPLCMKFALLGRLGQSAHSTSQSKAVWFTASSCMNNQQNLLEKKVCGTSWNKREQHIIAKHFLNKSFHQMNSSDSQKTPLSICILLGIGISTSITAVKLLYCKHESMPASSGSRRKGLF